jgi:cell shape-determining protein MreC
MFKDKLKKTFFLLLISCLFFVLSFKVYAKEEGIFNISLKWQKNVKNFWSKIFGFDEESFYKEKYYQLLEELAKLKLSLNEIKESDLSSIKQNYFLNKVVEADILKLDPVGKIFVEYKNDVSEGSLVLDKSWTLLGKVSKITKNYIIIDSLEIPGIEFNVANFQGELLGLAKTVSNGFLEVDFVDPKIKINLNDFVLTYGDDLFPAGFIVGSVSKVSKSQFNQKIIVKLTFNLKDKDKVYILK